MRSATRTRRALAAWLAAWLTVSTAGLCSVDLVKAGKPVATIIEPARTSEKVHKAATELQSYIDQMTGAKPPIVATGTQVEGNLIVLGTACAECPLGPGEPTQAQVGYDGFILRTEKNKVIIASRVEAGTLYAAYALLEKLGCRFYFPQEAGEVIPRTTDLTAPDLDIASRPAAVFRGQFWSCAPSFSGSNSLWRYLESWMVKNRLGGPDMGMNHIFDYVVPAAKYFGPHPEYFPEAVDANGKRERVRTGQLCVSNPDVTKLFVGWCRNYLDQNPSVLSASISENDYGGWCQCWKCQAWDGPERRISRRQLRFANTVAAEVAKTHSSKYVAYLGLYFQDELPPPVDMKANPNVLPVMVHTRYQARAVTDDTSAFERQWRGFYGQWARIADHLGVYEWFSCPGTTHISAPNVRWFLDHRMVAYLAEIISYSYLDHISYYLTARSLWDKDFDWRAALEEFYTKFYGPAAGPMKQIYETLAQANQKYEPAGQDSYQKRIGDWPLLCSTDLRNKLRRLAVQAAGLATEDAYRRRVQLASECLQALDLYANAVSAYNTWKAKPSAPAAAALQQEADRAQAYLEHVADEEVVAEVPMRAQLDAYREQVKQGGANSESARSQPGWNDEATFGDLWAGHEEVGPVPLAWKFHTDPRDKGQKASWFATDFTDAQWREIAIEEFWEVQGYPDYDGYAWYRVRLPIPAKAAGKKLLLVFGAVDEAAVVYLNGQLVGAHNEGPLGWDKRFSVDITRAARPGRGNVLAVRVFDSALKGGIWKSVKLVTPRMP